MSETKKILVVEDNDFVRMQIVKFLNDAGYETAESRDGQEALEKLSGDVALAIVDVRMEPMGGFDFMRILRSKNIHIPLILVTGDDDPNLLSEASRYSVGTVLKKPVQKERLIKSVIRILGVDKRER